MLRAIIAVIAGFVSAFAVMMAFEFANSLFFPFPAGMGVNDVDQVRAFAASMPFTALVLVELGWIVGSFAGGYIATRVAGGGSFTPAHVTGVMLTATGALNAFMIQNPLWFHIGSLPVFVLLTGMGASVAISDRSAA
jgi:hypothetical protein